MVKVSLFVFLVLELAVLNAQAAPDCGKYPITPTQQGSVCHRVGILPWLLGIPGSWETELRLSSGSDTVKFGFVSSLSLTSYNTNLVLEDSQWGSKTFESLSGLDLPKYGSHWTRILGACDANAGQCPPRAFAGSMIVTADSPSAAALDAVSAFGIYKYTSNDSVVSQASAPVIFLDQAAVRWTAVITETPRSGQNQSGASITSFAIANLSRDPQAVLVRIYDERGHLSASVKTPVLDQALGFSDSTEVLVGGVYADTLSNLLGVDLPPSPCPTFPQGFPAIGPPCAGVPVFRGTLVFEGEKGGQIAPVVFRFNGSALAAVPVRPE